MIILISSPHFTHSALSGAIPLHGIPALIGLVHPFERVLVPKVTGPLHSSIHSDQLFQDVHSPFSLDNIIWALQGGFDYENCINLVTWFYFGVEIDRFCKGGIR